VVLFKSISVAWPTWLFPLQHERTVLQAYSAPWFSPLLMLARRQEIGGRRRRILDPIIRMGKPTTTQDTAGEGRGEIRKKRAERHKRVEG
jgi:hypothetical protein